MAYQDWKWTGFNLNSFFKSAEKELSEFGTWMDNMGTVMGLDAETKKKAELLLGSVPLVGDVLQAKDEWNQTNQYLKTHDMSWADVRAPGSLNIFNRIGGRATNFVSSNIHRLYR